MKLAKFIPVVLSLLLVTSCYNSKVKYDILKESNIEKVNYDDIVLKEDYTSLVEHSLEEISVTSDEVEDKFEESLSLYYEYEKITDRSIKDGDVVRLRMICEYEGKYLNNYRIDGAEIEIGNNEFGNLIDDAVRGVIIDETTSILTKTSIPLKEVSYVDEETNSPIDSDEIVEINCYITLNYIQGEKSPPSDIDMAVKRATGYKYSNEGEFRSKIEHDILKQKQSELIYMILEEIIEADKVEFNLDLEPLYRTERNSLEAYYNRCATSNSMNFDEYSKSLGFSSMNDFKESINDTAKKLVKQKLLFYKLGTLNGWTLSNEDYSTYAKAKVVEMNYGSIEQAVSIFGSDILRWEIYKERFSEQFFEIFIEGYESEPEEDLSDFNDSMYEIVEEKTK